MAGEIHDPQELLNKMASMDNDKYSTAGYTHCTNCGRLAVRDLDGQSVCENCETVN